MPTNMLPQDSETNAEEGTSNKNEAGYMRGIEDHPYRRRSRINAPRNDTMVHADMPTYTSFCSNLTV